VEPFAGFEPQVGQIRALRTFRIGPDGYLYPLFSDAPWHDGPNTARCLRHDEQSHPSPDPDCRCGFYAYGTEQWAGDHPHSRHVLAVVACWGRIIAGTRGLRAEQCRIEALWLSEAVPEDLVLAVGRNYPSVAVHRDRQQMLAEHPRTELDCYEPPGRGSGRPVRRALWLAAVLAGLVGVLPAEWLGGDDSAAVLWVVLGAVFAVGVLPLPHRAGTQIAGRRLLCLATSMWMFAPFLGAFGLVFVRLPVLEAAAAIGLQRTCVLRESRRIPARIG